MKYTGRRGERRIFRRRRLRRKKLSDKGSSLTLVPSSHSHFAQFHTKKKKSLMRGFYKREPERERETLLSPFMQIRVLRERKKRKRGFFLSIQQNNSARRPLFCSEFLRRKKKQRSPPSSKRAP